MMGLVLLIVMVIWVVFGRKNWNKCKRVILYNSLMFSGRCTHCQGELRVSDFTKQYINVECDDCDSVYQMDTMVEMAWEITK